MAWYVLYTKPRNEKKVAQLLTDKGVEVYCPVREEIRQWSDRKKKILEPVFRSYIFVFLNDYQQENVSVLMTAGAVRFLWWTGKPGIVQDFEIAAIKDFLNNYKNAEIVTEMKTGQMVIIKEGPLRETTGTIIHIKKNIATLHLKSIGLNLVATLPIQSLAAVKTHK
jgi:transcription antitermination factor NusG